MASPRVTEAGPAGMLNHAEGNLVELIEPNAQKARELILWRWASRSIHGRRTIVSHALKIRAQKGRNLH